MPTYNNIKYYQTCLRHVNDGDEVEQLEGVLEQRRPEQRHRLLPERAEERAAGEGLAVFIFD